MNDNALASYDAHEQPNRELAAPILKWAGGKTQLLSAICSHLPVELLTGQLKKYVEPFVGGGAVFFHFSNIFSVRDSYLFDVNPEIVNLLNSVRDSVDEVIAALKSLEDKYLGLSPDNRAAFFYEIREKYNQDSKQALQEIRCKLAIPERAAFTIFLNRTCFNGLFRVNKSGRFNVPHGRYKHPAILNRPRLFSASRALQRATISLADFSDCLTISDSSTFVYYDPPYRPLSKTSSFTSYSRDTFDDSEQKRLFEVFKASDGRGVLQLLSNSDPTNNGDDTFFDDLYREFSIHRVPAKRMINSNGSKRGELRELLIKNY